MTCHVHPHAQWLFKWARGSQSLSVSNQHQSVWIVGLASTPSCTNSSAAFIFVQLLPSSCVFKPLARKRHSVISPSGFLLARI